MLWITEAADTVVNVTKFFQMARVVYGGLVTGIHGSIGGTTLQESKFGSTIRNKPRPLRNVTPAQRNLRSLMSQLQYAWRDLTVEERIMWNRFNQYSLQTIRRSGTVAISGYALFLKYNMLRLLNGYSLMTSFSYTPLAQIPINYELVNDSDTFYYFACIDGFDDFDLFYSLKISAPRGAQLSWSLKGLRFCPLIPPNYGSRDFDTWAPATFGKQYDTGDICHIEITWASVTSPIILKPQRLILTMQST